MGIEGATAIFPLRQRARPNARALEYTPWHGRTDTHPPIEPAPYALADGSNIRLKNRLSAFAGMSSAGITAKSVNVPLIQVPSPIDQDSIAQAPLRMAETRQSPFVVV